MIDPKYIEIKRGNNVIGNVITWEGIKKDDDCGWAECVGSKRSAFISGEFGKDCDGCLEGSNDQKGIGKLTGHFGVNLKFKANEFLEVNEASRFIRPKINNGDDDTNLTVSIMVIL